MSGKVAREVCEAEFTRFLEAMDLTEKCDAKQYDGDDLKSFLDTKATIISAMERGLLCVDEKGQPVYTPQLGNSGPIVFYEPSGADLMAMDQAKKGHDIEKQNKLLAAMTKRHPGDFAKLAMRDYRVCTAIQVLFLA